MEKTSIFSKISSVVNKLPFSTLAAKVPLLAGVASYANYAACILFLVLGLGIVGSAVSTNPINFVKKAKLKADTTRTIEQAFSHWNNLKSISWSNEKDEKERKKVRVTLTAKNADNFFFSEDYFKQEGFGGIYDLLLLEVLKPGSGSLIYKNSISEKNKVSEDEIAAIAKDYLSYSSKYPQHYIGYSSYYGNEYSMDEVYFKLKKIEFESNFVFNGKETFSLSDTNVLLITLSIPSRKETYLIRTNLTSEEIINIVYKDRPFIDM